MALEIKDGVLIKYHAEKGETEVTVPAGVTMVCNGAFWECSWLTRITLPEGLKEIKSFAFWNCTALEKINIPEGVVSIEKNAFACCEHLQEVRIGPGLQQMGERCFYRCRSLRSVTLPDSLTTLGRNAFQSCFSVHYFRADGLKRLAEEALYISPGSVLVLPHVKLEGQSPQRKWAMLWGYLQQPDRFDEAAAEDYARLLSSQRKRLLPRVLAEDCAAALQLLADHGKITVQNYREEYLDPAQAADASACVAFLLAWKNSHITAEMEEQALLAELMRDPTSAIEIKKRWAYATNADGSKTLIKYKGEDTGVLVPAIVAKKPVTALGVGLFYGRSDLTEITVPEGITHIGEDAFGYCGGLQRLALPESVVSIGKFAFRGCTGLRELVIPGPLQSMGLHALQNTNKKLLLRAPAGGEAERYAKGSNIRFQAL